MFALIRALSRIAEELSAIRASLDRLTEALSREPEDTRQIAEARWTHSTPQEEV